MWCVPYGIESLDVFILLSFIVIITDIIIVYSCNFVSIIINANGLRFFPHRLPY